MAPRWDAHPGNLRSDSVTADRRYADAGNSAGSVYPFPTGLVYSPPASDHRVRDAEALGCTLSVEIRDG